jgi:hypothetical protein
VVCGDQARAAPYYQGMAVILQFGLIYCMFNINVTQFNISGILNTTDVEF